MRHIYVQLDTKQILYKYSFLRKVHKNEVLFMEVLDRFE